MTTTDHSSGEGEAAPEQHTPRGRRDHRLCGTCDVPWPCPTASAALDTVDHYSEYGEARDRPSRNAAIRYAIALGLPHDDVGRAAGITRERARQIGCGQP